MEYYAGIDVSLETASLCLVDATGRIVREAKVASEPEILIGWFRGPGAHADADRACGGTAVAVAVCGHPGGELARRVAGSGANGTVGRLGWRGERAEVGNGQAEDCR
jgi:hypothetical protein